MDWLRPALAVAGAVVIVVAASSPSGRSSKGFGFIGLGADSASQPAANSGRPGADGNT